MKIAILFTFSIVAAHSHHDCIPYDPPPLPSGEIYDSFDAANEQIDSMISIVDQWSSAQGIFSALNIQQVYYNMYSAMQNLADVAAFASFDRLGSINIATEYSRHSGGIAKLLSALAEKADDFKSFHVEPVIREDILNIARPVAQAQSCIFVNFPSDAPCDALSTISRSCRHLTEALEYAGKSYNVEPISLAPVPTSCRPYC